MSEAMVKLRRDPSPADWADWERRVAAGEDFVQAARARNMATSGFRKQDYERHQAVLALSRELRGYVADRVVEDDVTVRKDGVPIAFKPDASDSMKQFWARRWQPAYQAAQVQVSGELEVKSDVSDAIDRFTEAVAAAAVRSAAGGGAGEPGEHALQRGEGRARLAVAQLAGEAEPARA